MRLKRKYMFSELKLTVPLLLLNKSSPPSPTPTEVNHRYDSNRGRLNIHRRGNSTSRIEIILKIAVQLHV